jgi:hypothetical protein
MRIKFLTQENAYMDVIFNRKERQGKNRQVRKEK